jgi:DNA polymerase-3 subunit beta
VIPKSGTTTVTLDAGGFLADVRRAALATDDESKRVEFNFEGGKVVMAARSATAGSSAVVHTATDHRGPDVVISFDPHYLTDARHALTGEVVLSLNGPDKAGVFRRDSVLYLVVPLA